MKIKISSQVVAALILVGALFALVPESGAQTDVQTGVWTLEASVQRALEAAPELRAADAEIAVREGELKQAGSWPNPTIELSASNKLGIEDSRSGADLTQLVFSQPLPMRRLARQRAMAEANIAVASANRNARRLLLEREVARVFHAVQLSTSRRALAQERLKLATGFLKQNRHGAGDPLVRFLTPLERRRLAILNEDAQQTVLLAERDHDKALIEFRAFLKLPVNAPVELAALIAPAMPPGMGVLAQSLENHPALVAAQQETEAARAGIAVADSQRFTDPALNLFHERDYLNGARRTVTGIGVSIQIPLWNSNKGSMDKAKAETMGAEARFAAASRDAHIRLEQSHLQLVRLLAQEERLRTNLLEPAREVFRLTRRGFTAGELNVLTLMDASNTYFDANSRYLDLLQESELAAADLRLASGASLLNSSLETQP